MRKKLQNDSTSRGVLSEGSLLFHSFSQYRKSSCDLLKNGNPMQNRQERFDVLKRLAQFVLEHQGARARSTGQG